LRCARTILTGRRRRGPHVRVRGSRAASTASRRDAAAAAAAASTTTNVGDVRTEAVRCKRPRCRPRRHPEQQQQQEEQQQQPAICETRGGGGGGGFLLLLVPRPRSLAAVVQDPTLSVVGARARAGVGCFTAVRVGLGTVSSAQLSATQDDDLSRARLPFGSRPSLCAPERRRPPSMVDGRRHFFG
jgi:hypothetical protein